MTQFNSEYDKTELRDALKRAFINNNADFIVVDSNPHGQRFLYAGINLGLEEKLIYQSGGASDSQSAVYEFRPRAKLFRELGGMSEEESLCREALSSRFASTKPDDLESNGYPKLLSILDETAKKYGV